MEVFQNAPNFFADVEISEILCVVHALSTREAQSVDPSSVSHYDTVQQVQGNPIFSRKTEAAE